MVSLAEAKLNQLVVQQTRAVHIPFRMWNICVVSLRFLAIV